MMPCPGDFPPSAVEHHVGTLVQIHVGVAKQTLGHALHVSWDLIGQLCEGHVQVDRHLWAGLHLRDVEAINLTCPPQNTETETEREFRAPLSLSTSNHIQE